MDNREIINLCKKQLESNDYIVFPEDVFNDLSEENAQIVTEIFGKSELMKLPEKEIEFFEWLKMNDRDIWDDLWDAEEDPYVVSVNFLPLLMNKTRGFPICDLLNNDNYYFTSSHMVDQESKDMIESVQNMYMDKKKLTIEQTLVLEISIAPIDIWRFAYHYNIPIYKAKNAVSNLVYEKILVHLKESEHIANFIEF
jgi:hypothetical protein